MAADLAGEHPDIPDEVQLLRFEAGAPGGSFPVVSRFRGKVVGPDFYDGVTIQPGSWWFCKVEDKGTFYIAHPVKEFDVEDMVRARPALLPTLFPYLEQDRPARPAAAARSPAPSPPAEGFVPLPRVEAVRVTPAGLELDLALDLLDGAAACELLADPARGALALRPAPGSRHAWPVRDGALRSREPARALGEGPAWARWSDRLGVLVVTRDL